MKYSRYGKFQIKDLWSMFDFALTFLGFGILGIIYNISMISNFICILVAIIDAIIIIQTCREKFEVRENVLTTYKGKKVKEIRLPSYLTVVVSYADVCDDLTKRLDTVNEAVMLKDKWSVSLLHDVSVENVLERLHGKYAWRYTNRSVEVLVKSHFIYGFVCDQSMLEKVLLGKEYTMILPETLADKVDIQKLKGNIYIDKGF